MLRCLSEVPTWSAAERTNFLKAGRMSKHQRSDFKEGCSDTPQTRKLISQCQTKPGGGSKLVFSADLTTVLLSQRMFSLADELSWLTEPPPHQQTLHNHTCTMPAQECRLPSPFNQALVFKDSQCLKDLMGALPMLTLVTKTTKMFAKGLFKSFHVNVPFPL